MFVCFRFFLIINLIYAVIGFTFCIISQYVFKVNVFDCEPDMLHYFRIRIIQNKKNEHQSYARWIYK